MNEEINPNVTAPIETRTASSVKDLCFIAVFTAMISILSQLSIPMPAGVPMTLQTLIIPLAGIVLGKKRGTYSTLLYLLIGAVGVPVFSGFSGGIGVLLNLTGGFLISFPILSLTAGLGDELGHKLAKRTNFSKKFLYYIPLVLCLVIGATINYVFGTVWFMLSSKSTFIAGLSACVLPFIPTSVLKIIIVTVIGPELKKRLSTILH
ncbi:biotin transporter BioY [Butyrivibrio sp. AE3004]|uniref:biotin transporter BioY n=1 Tax=Butyrivibrio sp. AE3004 TaxID=1506994 RepID=UPI0009DF1E8E|nr:biotin transporter BioY [Butyrivibrio sp. AE3004]